MVNHVDLEEADRHEPKGISSAIAGAVYHATGTPVDGGTWKLPAFSDYGHLGRISVSGADATTISGTLDNWTTLNPGAWFSNGANGVSVSTANGTITLTNAGTYLVMHNYSAIADDTSYPNLITNPGFTSASNWTGFSGGPGAGLWYRNAVSDRADFQGQTAALLTQTIITTTMVSGDEYTVCWTDGGGASTFAVTLGGTVHAAQVGAGAGCGQDLVCGAVDNAVSFDVTSATSSYMDDMLMYRTSADTTTALLIDGALAGRVNEDSDTVRSNYDLLTVAANTVLSLGAKTLSGQEGCDVDLSFANIMVIRISD